MMTTHTVKPDFSQYGFAHQENLIMAFIEEPRRNGAKVGMTAYIDWSGLYIPSPSQVLGIDVDTGFVFPEGAVLRKDVHVCLFTLGQWAKLAAKGHFPALYFLFAPLKFTSETWNLISSRPQLFLAKKHVASYLEFPDEDMMKRLLWRMGPKKVHRTPVEERLGYDTEFAVNMIRLYGEAMELMEKGYITFPRPENEELVAIGNGKYSLSEFKELFLQLQSDAVAAQAISPLPDAVDRHAISELLAEAHLNSWRKP
jgi:hypothetical protein